MTAVVLAMMALVVSIIAALCAIIQTYRERNKDQGGGV